jgi:hypothetical protein
VLADGSVDEPLAGGTDEDGGWTAGVARADALLRVAAGVVGSDGAISMMMADRPKNPTAIARPP